MAKEFTVHETAKIIDMYVNYDEHLNEPGTKSRNFYGEKLLEILDSTFKGLSEDEIFWNHLYGHDWWLKHD